MNCHICGQPLQYFKHGEELTCYKCGKIEIGNIKCLDEHYLCDDCHGDELFNFIKDYLINSSSKSPLEIAIQLIDSVDELPMLGCEHAWIAGGALITSIKNEGSINISDLEIIEVLNRIRRQAIGGYCGLTGVCGIALAVGATFSVILGAACPKNKETVITMKVVSRIIDAIANETGPCCCKNFVVTALIHSIELAKNYLDINVEDNLTKKWNCNHSNRHPHGCREEKCTYY